jgi:CheY-like chemotaxis protein
MRQVLIVGEVRSLRVLLGHILEDEGYTVIEMADGHAARDVLRRSRDPMVALLNTSASGDGLGVLRAVTAEPALGRHAYVLVTANAECLSPLWRQLVAELAVPVVAKPFDLEVLLDVVGAAAARLAKASGALLAGR